VFVQRREWISAEERMFEECGFAAGGLTGKIERCLGGETAESRMEGGREGKEGEKERRKEGREEGR